MKPCFVEMTSRQVIEHKLLTALEDDNTVAALLSKQDVEDLITALRGFDLGGMMRQDALTWKVQAKRCKNLAEGLSQLLSEAFPGEAQSK